MPRRIAPLVMCCALTLLAASVATAVELPHKDLPRFTKSLARLAKEDSRAPCAAELARFAAVKAPRATTSDQAELAGCYSDLSARRVNALARVQSLLAGFRPITTGACHKLMV